MSLAEARAKAEEWRGLAKAGTDPAILEAKKKAAREREAMLAEWKTFASVVEDYKIRVLPRQRWGERVRKLIEVELIPSWGARPIAEIGRVDVVALIDKIVARPAPRYAHNVFDSVRALFNFAVARGVYGIETAPTDRLKASEIIGRKAIRQRVLTDAELRKLWLACGALGYPYGPLVKMILLTGTRLSEMRDAEWREFDFPARLWRIPEQRFKSGSQHIVPLCDDLLALLESLPRRGRYLFATNGNDKPVRGFDVPIKKFREAVGAHDWSLHDLRRTTRTKLSKLAPFHVCELAIGHAKQGLQRVYDQEEYRDEIRAALDKWAAALREIVEPEPATPPAQNVVALRRRG
jgi:integrase